MNRAAPSFNPFPGLRPFTTAERHLFFGREAQSAELLARLRRFRFLAAVGPSGSGKSSLVRAGMLPELHGGTMRGVGSHWQVASMRPGGDPVRNLATALREAQLFDDADPDAGSIVTALLSRSRLGLVDAVAKSALPQGANLLLLVDQFEELFRFQRAAAETADTAGSFVSLLLEAARQAAVPIYVVITMRSDFLGDCAMYRGLAEAVNESEYLIPRLTREQWKLAIEGPVRVGGGQIAPRLTQRLLNDVADDPDQLPTLQHALMRTWDRWVTQGATGRPIDLEDYEAVGGMSEALSRHADEVYAALPDEGHRRVAEFVFRALTDVASDSRGLRRPTRLGDLVSLTQASEAEVRAVIDAFRAAGRAFLTPSTELGSDSVIDISHESLMRLWRRLRGWADAEAQSTRMFRRLADAADWWRQGRGGLFRDPALEYALQWRAEDRPSQAWAERLGGGFKQVEEFLEASRAAREAEREAREAARRRELEQAMQLAEALRLRAEAEARGALRMRRVAWIMALLAVLALTACGVAWHLRRIAEARALVADARDAAHTDPERALVHSLKAWEGYASDFTEASLRRDLLASLVRRTLRPVAASAQGGVPGPVLGFRRVAVSPDGRVIAGHGVDDETGAAWLWLWRSQTGETNRLRDGAGELKAMEFTPDSRFLLTAGGDDTARLWDVERNRLATSFRAFPGLVVGAAFGPGGTNVMLADDTGRIELWDWDGTTATRRAEWEHRGGIADAAYGPRGEFVATAGKDGRVLFWRPGMREPFYRNEVSGNPLTAIAFSGQGRWMAVVAVEEGPAVDAVRDPAAPSARRVFLYDQATGYGPRWSSREPGSVNALRFSPSEDELALVRDRGVEFWDVRSLGASAEGTPRAPARRRVAAESLVFEAGYSADGDWFFTALDNHEVRLWSPRGVEVARFRGHERQVNGAAWHPGGGSMVSASLDGALKVWDVRAGLGTRVRAAGADDEVKAAAIDGSRLVLRGQDGIWRLWHAAQPPQPVRPVAQMVTNFSATVFSPDGRWVATAEDLDVFLRQGDDGTLVGSFPPSAGPAGLAGPAGEGAPLSKPLALAFSLDGRRLGAVDAQGGIRIWSVSERASAGTLAGQPATFPRLALDGDGATVVLAGDGGTVQCWRGVRTAPVALSAAALQDGVYALAVDPDGAWVAAGSIKGSVWLCRTDDPSSGWEFPAHELAVNALAWTADGRYLASGGADGAICLWARARAPGANAAQSFELIGRRRGFATGPVGTRDWTLAGLSFAGSGGGPGRHTPAVLVAVSGYGEIRRYVFPELSDRAALASLARDRLANRVPVP